MFTLKRLAAAVAAAWMLAVPSFAEDGKLGTYTQIDAPPASAQ